MIHCSSSAVWMTGGSLCRRPWCLLGLAVCLTAAPLASRYALCEAFVVRISRNAEFKPVAWRGQQHFMHHGRHRHPAGLDSKWPEAPREKVLALAARWDGTFGVKYLVCA